MAVGKRLLEALREWGAERVYAVLGTDHITLMREFEAGTGVSLFTVPHEFVAASMALGESISGKLGVVLLHSVPGSLNASGVLMNALTSRVPLLALVGESPPEAGEFGRTLRVHWSSDLEFPRLPVKRVFEMREKPVETLNRAIALALSEPQGPVIVRFRRDLLAKECGGEKGRKTPYFPGASKRAIERANELLSKLTRVQLITWRGGRSDEAFDAIKGFADSNNVPVANPVGERVNYPSNGEMASTVLDAEGYIIVEHEAPQVEGIKVWVDPDPLYSLIEDHSFDCDLCVQSTPQDFLPHLRVKNDLDWARAGREELEKRRESGSTRCVLARELSRTGLTVFDEYQLEKDCIVATRREQYFGDLASNHLGWAFGASLGYSVARGERTVAVMGDGAFYLSSPLSNAYVIRKAKLDPIVVVVDNSSWGSVRREYERFFGEGTNLTELDNLEFSKFAETIDAEYLETKDPRGLAEEVVKLKGPVVVRVKERG